MNDAKPTSGWNEATPPTLPTNPVILHLTLAEAHFLGRLCLAEDEWSHPDDYAQDLKSTMAKLHQALVTVAALPLEGTPLALDPDDDTPEDRAVALLGRLGWTCTPPKYQPAEEKKP